MIKLLVDNSNSWISYYSGIEQTYIDGGVQSQPSVYASYVQPQWPAGCDALDVLQSLDVPDTRSNGMFYILNSGYVAAIFIQPLLCNLLWYTFELLQPLSAFNGRVMMDLNHATTDVNKFDEFIIAQNFVWWCVNVLGILLVLLNLFLPENFEWNF